MEQVKHFLMHLFGTESWPARWFCGNWSDFHGWLYILSSLAIWAAYFAIPLILICLLAKRKDSIPFQRIFWLFILFILSCGLTHVVDAVIFWLPIYRVSALVLFFTAIISWITVFALFKVVPEALTLKSPSQLEKVVAERTNQLAIANDNLTRLNKDMDNFIYSASHDLKSPLNNIEGLLNLLKSAISSNNNTNEINSLIERVHASTTKAKATIVSLTNVVKLQSNPYQDVQKVDIREIIKEILFENEMLVRANKAIVTFTLNIEEIEYSRQALKSILYNLIINAIKYKSPDRNPRIEVCSTYNSFTKRIEITVKDNGLGIDLNLYRDKIFNLFKRFHEHIEGSGIGLYIIHRLIESKGGNIEVESTVNAGSTFKVIF
jgi:chemotaxis family two-component system sensor kinase Cph1